MDDAEGKGAGAPRSRFTQRLGVWWVLPAGLFAGLTVLLLGSIRQGGYVASAALVVAAMLRLVLPAEKAGGLSVRSRTWDVIVLLALAVALAVISASLVLPAERVGAA